MEPEGDAPITSLDESKVSTPHTLEGEELQLQFPPKGLPNLEGIPASLPPSYVSLRNLVLGTPSASSLYHNFVFASGVRHKPGSFVMNMTSQPVVTSIPVQPTVPNTLVPSIPVTHQLQLVVSNVVFSNSFIPLVSGQIVPPPGGKNLNVSMVSSATNVICSQAHMLGINQPSSGIIYNLADPSRLRNV